MGGEKNSGKKRGELSNSGWRGAGTGTVKTELYEMKGKSAVTQEEPSIANVKKTCTNGQKNGKGFGKRWT